MNAFVAALFRVAARRRTAALLRDLDDHLLADIGLTRGAVDTRRRRDPRG